MKTIADALALLDSMLQSDDTELAGHARTLVGHRSRGSTTSDGLDELPGSTGLSDDTGTLPDQVKAPGCRYFTAFALGLNPCVGAITYRTAVEMFGKEAVRERQGPHGPELYIDQSEEDARLVPVAKITIIVGPFKDKGDVIYTWHPGLPLAPLRGAPCDYTAVKLHRGL